MAKFPSSGVNVPGYLNTCNSPSMTGYADQVGNPFFMGLTPGKIITLGPTEVSQFQAPGTTLYDGAYQWVQLDSGATAANAVAGKAAYILLDQGGAPEGTQPETAYAVPTVTTGDIANSLGLNSMFCGVFINPSTFNGQANTPTPGNWCFIFVGAGRAQVLYGTTVTGGLGGAVFPDATHVGTFESLATLPTAPVPYGAAVSTPVASTAGVAYFSDFINRIPF